MWKRLFESLDMKRHGMKRVAFSLTRASLFLSVDCTSWHFLVSVQHYPVIQSKIFLLEIGIICDMAQYCQELMTNTQTAEEEEDLALLSHEIEMSHRFQFLFMAAIYATSRKVAGSIPDGVIGFFFSIDLAAL
jgi:hypothetical protein